MLVIIYKIFKYWLYIVEYYLYCYNDNVLDKGQVFGEIIVKIGRLKGKCEVGGDKGVGFFVSSVYFGGFGEVFFDCFDGFDVVRYGGRNEGCIS